MAQITTDRLLLRAARPDDVDPLWDVFRRPEAMKYWSTLPHATRSQTTELVEGMIAHAADAPYFVVQYQEQAIGTAGFWSGNEVGFILHPQVWGQGIGGELLDALIPHGFEVCDFTHILADVDPDNAASIGLLQSRGFQEIGRAERTLQLGDVWVDSVYFSLAQEDWTSS